MTTESAAKQAPKALTQVQFDAIAAELLASRALVLEITQRVSSLTAKLGPDNVSSLNRVKTPKHIGT